jgi:plasmid stabilization system protein ParE
LMPYRIRIDPEAVEEIGEGIEWYDQRRPGLGEEFLGEVRAAISSLRRPGPECIAPVGVPVDLGVRRQFVRRFPYVILFVEFKRLIRVIAVAHAHQRPGYWRKRL